jgi:23S rRNA pseudouridine2605 synthase
MTAGEKGERIAKAIARAGVCSRREAERLIAEGRVALDGTRLDSPAVNVTAQARITIDGKPLPAPAPVGLWRYHKPKGLITTARDPQGRPTVFEALPPELGRVLSIGRLDLNSEGLLLLTNDGALKRRLELPAGAWTRRYRVRVHGRVEPAALAGLAGGVTVSGVDYGPIQAELERQSGSNAWLSMAFAEGKNREVRRVLEHLGLAVNRLIRVAYGPFQLGHLARGQVEAVPAKVLREQLGIGGGGGRKTGFAKAKPRPPKPGARKAKSGGAGRGKAGAKHAHRRRTT